MRQCPEMGHANISEERHQELELTPFERATERIPRSLRARRLERRRPLIGLEPRQSGIELRVGRDSWPPQQPHDLLDREWRDGGIAGDPAATRQEPDVTDEAIADFAKSKRWT
jgi:hypothetical protein